MLSSQRDGLGESVREKMRKHAWRARKAAVLAILAGCTAAPPDDRPTFSWKWEIALTDSCEELAGFLAMMDLFGTFGIDWGPDMANATTEVHAEMEKRCPDDVEPEALDSTFSIQTIACADLRNLVIMVDAFGMSTHCRVTSGKSRRNSWTISIPRSRSGAPHWIRVGVPLVHGA